MNTRRRILVLAVLALLLLGLSTALALACPPPGAGTPGFYKEPGHWPGWIDKVTICGTTYTKAEAIAIMKTPVSDDKTYTMFKALVAAKLNLEWNWGNREYVDCILDIVDQADGWMCTYPVGSGVKGNSYAWQDGGGEWKYEMLDAYNNGRLCAPSRDDLEND